MPDRAKTDLDRDTDQTNAGLQAIEKLRGTSVATRTQKAWDRMLEEHRCKGNQECGANGPSQTQVLCNHGFQACVSDCPESAQSVFFKGKSQFRLAYGHHLCSDSRWLCIPVLRRRFVLTTHRWVVDCIAHGSIIGVGCARASYRASSHTNSAA